MSLKEEGNIELLKAVANMPVIIEVTVELIEPGLPQEDIEVELFLLGNLNNILNRSLIIIVDF